MDPDAQEVSGVYTKWPEARIHMDSADTTAVILTIYR
jgi:hypothetical protein